MSTIGSARLGGSADKIARLVGAAAGEVIVADSTSVNLFKLLAAAVRHQAGRSVILSEPGNFPTDLYIAQGLSGLAPDCRLKTVPADEIIAAIDDDTAVVHAGPTCTTRPAASLTWPPSPPPPTPRARWRSGI